MFNVAVVNIKDVAKYLVSVIVVIILITGITRYFNNLKENSKTEETSKKVENDIVLKGLSDVIPGMQEINDILYEENDDTDVLEDILKVELGMISENKKYIEEVSKEITEETTGENIISNEIAEEDNHDIVEVSTNVKTEVVTENPIAERFTNQISKVKIKNETSYEITEDMFSSELNITNKNILIFHTHTCESYTPSAGYEYTQTGNYRTTDKNYTVARVGEELTNYLKQYGYNVVHDTTYHDYPAYSGSYTRSLETVSNLLKNQDAEIIIDLHRDAIGSNSNYAPTVKIGDEYAAQVMFVIGTNGGGLWHPNWKKNLEFAIKVQQKADEMYPGLFKPIILRNSRYNQHLGDAACIIEVGATGNTLEQCLVSQKYLAKVLDEVLK